VSKYAQASEARVALGRTNGHLTFTSPTTDSGSTPRRPDTARVCRASLTDSAPSTVGSRSAALLVGARPLSGRSLCEHGPRRDRCSTPARWPWVAFGVFFAAALVGIVGVVVNDESVAAQLPFIVAFGMFGVVGALIASRDRGNVIGLLLLEAR